MRKYLPLVLIGSLMITSYWLEVFTIKNFKGLQELDPLIAAPFFFTLYIICTTLSLPVGAYLSLLGGFLFPQPYSFLLVLFGATFGASFLFLAARNAFKDTLQKKADPYIKKFKVEGDAANYLLFLRLVPIFPFWIVNLAPALVGISFRTYLWTTLVGIMPGVFLFTQAGSGLGSLLNSDGLVIFTPEIKLAFIAAGIFILLPVIIRRNSR